MWLLVAVMECGVAVLVAEEFAEGGKVGVVVQIEW